MSTVNQKSVREEAERIKNEFDRLSVSIKINSEYKILFSKYVYVNKFAYSDFS